MQASALHVSRSGLRLACVTAMSLVISLRIQSLSSSFAEGAGRRNPRIRREIFALSCWSWVSWKSWRRCALTTFLGVMEGAVYGHGAMVMIAWCQVSSMPGCKDAFAETDAQPK